MTENENKELFIKATNQLMEMKDEVIANYQEMKEVLFSMADLENKQSNFDDEVNAVAELIENCINENNRVAPDQIE
ncbi:hypothetical protein [Enterococcus mundtii]|uniref:hypothetical protein n=1 Tax=Enterococcus mundtii TaxID=53346 RepID=UPI0013788C57|nr:hypothetical protein [Enterococcus mundtii]NBA62610.1 hypothetical protein [Enterococcus mundtii]